MSTSIKSVPGISLGCYNIDAILHSSLEVFFNQNEINDMLRSLSGNNDSDGMYSSLNQTALNKFSTNTIGKELAARLFVDLWTDNISHQKYFEFCQPIQCQYSFISTNSLITIVTIVLGIIGGLYSILRFLVPWIIYIIFRIKDKFNRTNNNSTVTEIGKFICEIN